MQLHFSPPASPEIVVPYSRLSWTPSSKEPHALVELGADDRIDTAVPATELPLFSP